MLYVLQSKFNQHSNAYAKVVLGGKLHFTNCNLVVAGILTMNPLSVKESKCFTIISFRSSVSAITIFG